MSFFRKLKLGFQALILTIIIIAAVLSIGILSTILPILLTLYVVYKLLTIENTKAP